MTTRPKGESGTRRTAASKKTEPVVDPDDVTIDLDDLTGAEIEAVEELTGLPITRAHDLQKPQGRLLRGLGWVFRVRDDPDMPYEVEDCDRGARPRCADCICSRRLKIGIRVAAPVPPSGGNG